MSVNTPVIPPMKPGIERVQAFADISHSAAALCCHSNETRYTPIANLPNSAQLQGNPYHSPTYIRVHTIVWKCSKGQTDRQTDRQRDGGGHYNTFASATPQAKCNYTALNHQQSWNYFYC